MEYRTKHLAVEATKTACLVVGVFENHKLGPAAEQINTASNGYLAKLLKTGDFSAKTGRTLMLYDVPGIQAKRVLLTGYGTGNITLQNYQTIHSAAVRHLIDSNIDEAVSFLTELEVANNDRPALTRHAVIAAEDALYRFDRFKSPKSTDTIKLRNLVFAQTDKQLLQANEAAAAQGQAIAAGISRAKTLGDLPGNICTPSYLAKEAKTLQREFDSIKTTVIDEAEMKKLGMGALLSVAKGSKEPAKLIVMEYLHGKKDKAPIVIVGKGITFDTGGISIKPALGMDEMKFDMCGAASVLGVMTACATLSLPVNLIGVIASAENMPGGGASKPGDIVTSMSGQTIEILNTDAEGRLVLCDALTYVERYKPAAVIDIATLTGAIIIALGRIPSGLFGNNAELIGTLKQAGDRSGDRVWELPLWEEYGEQLKTNFADVANVGNRDGGSITAASFLSRFAKNYPWAHLDIAGTAWKTGNTKGATGRPVPLLMQYILNKLA
jgi:leucyl aminopeptidase